jgi:hypothetical protein
MNRHGLGTRVSVRDATAGLMAAAAVQASLAAAHVGFGYSLDDPTVLHDLSMLWIGGGVVVALWLIGLRFLASGIPALPVGLSMITAVTLLVPQSYWSQRVLAPADAPMVERIDLKGNAGAPLAATAIDGCIWTGGPVPEGCIVLVAAPPDTPLSDIPVSGSRIVVERGGRSLGYRGSRWNGPLELTVDEEGFHIHYAHDGIDVHLADPLALHAYLREQEDYRLEVTPSPQVTLQHYVSMCASLGETPVCSVKR